MAALDPIADIRAIAHEFRDFDPDTRTFWRLGDVRLLLSEIDRLQARLAAAEKAVADLMTEVSS